MFSGNRRSWRLVFTVLVGLLLSFLGIALPYDMPNDSSAATGSIPDWYPVVLADPIIGPGIMAEAADDDFSNCRFGAAYVGTSQGSEAWLPSLNAGWFLTFQMQSPAVPSAEFVPVVRVRQLFGIGGRTEKYYYIPPLEEVKAYVSANPGSLVLIGNEIEIDNNIQDNIMPDVYARAYHEAYHAIKSVDPTTNVGIGSVTMVTPGRRQYLDLVLNTYEALYKAPIPVDVWNIHLYILPERTLNGSNHADGKIALGTDPNLAISSSAGNPAYCPQPDLPDLPESDPRHDIYCVAEHDSARIFQDQIIAMRDWMQENGEQNKPLIISEYGTLYAYRDPQPDGSCSARQDEFGLCMYPARVTEYLSKTMTFMDTATDPLTGYPQDDYHLVQRWLWYSLHTSHLVGSSSNLLQSDYTQFDPGSDDALTSMGETFRDLARNSRDMPNLVAGSARSSDVFLEHAGDTATVTIAANFRNDSVINIARPFAVSFYSDENLTQYISTVLVNPAEDGLVRGCSWQLPEHVVTFEWSGLTPGVHTYWARIDSSLSIPEESEDDNVTTMGRVTVYADNAFVFDNYMPMVRR